MPMRNAFMSFDLRGANGRMNYYSPRMRTCVFGIDETTSDLYLT